MVQFMTARKYLQYVETDRERVERWLRRAQSRVTCDITIVSETSNSKCSFTDEDGTLIEFVVEVKVVSVFLCITHSHTHTLLDQVRI